MASDSSKPKSRRNIKDGLTVVALFLFVAVAIVFPLYSAVAWNVFAWRNPKANRMSYIRDFGAVMRFERMARYQ